MSDPSTESKDEISMETLIRHQLDRKKSIDFTKPESELTDDERADRIIYNAFDKVIEEHLGSEKKKEIDDALNEMNGLEKLQANVHKFSDLAKIVEKNLVIQTALLRAHYDKSEENTYRQHTESMTNSLIDKANDLTPEQRVKLANDILGFIQKYRTLVEKDLIAKQEVNTALLPKLDAIHADTDFSLIEKSFQHPTREELAIGSDSANWLKLTKQLVDAREKIIVAVHDHIDMDEIIPRSVANNNGDLSATISAYEMNSKGDNFTKLTTEVNELENKINPLRDQYTEAILGKPENYLDFGTEPASNDVSVPAKSTGNKKMSWFIVIALSIVALVGGIWTAIGVFILGSIVIYLLKK